MDTLSSTLLAAQKSPSSVPYVYAKLEDYEGSAARYRFSRVYTGSEASNYAAVCVAPDGSLVRARRDGSTVYVDRIATPGSGSTFSSWTSLGAISSTTGALALCSGASSVYLFYVHTDTLGVRVRVSADNGATWGTATTVATAASAVTYLAADVSTTNGNVVVFWTVGLDVWVSRYTSSWSAAASWGKSAEVDGLTGIAVHWRFDFQFVATGIRDPGADPTVWTVLYGDGVDQTSNTWGSLLTIDRAYFATGVDFYAPALEFAGNAHRLFYLERSTDSVAYWRVKQSWLDAGENLSVDRWREPWPLDYSPTVEYGVACAYDFTGGKFWLVASNGVWLATLASVAGLDVTARVVEASVTLEEDDGRARLELNNADGVLTGNASISRGMRLTLTPGYRTTAGAELPTLARYYWVESVEYITGARPRAVLHARNGWWLLERWQAKKQYTWAAGTAYIFDALQFVMGRCGLSVSAADASATLQTWQPFLTVSAGESGKNVLRRLLGSVADVVRFSTGVGQVVEPETGDATDYAYGAGHAIVEGRYQDSGPAVNRTRVVGAADFAESFDHGDIAAVGERASAPIVDLNLSTATLTTNRAGFELRKAQIHARRDRIAIFGVNCGQELYDVVEVTDAQAGLSAAKRRVLGLSWRYETEPRQAYGMTLELGVV